MQVTLAIVNQRDWQSLMPILERLGITYKVQKTQTNEEMLSESEQDWEIIMRGIKKDDMDSFVREFDESRQDRTLPYRNKI